MHVRNVRILNFYILVLPCRGFYAKINLMKNSYIDGGKTFDWGRTSADYAKYRDIYPEQFYKKIVARGLCVEGQRVLDLGTGTGVLPRNMYKYGARVDGS